MVTTEEHLMKKVVLHILWEEENRFQNRMCSAKIPSIFSNINYTQKNREEINNSFSCLSTKELFLILKLL